MKQCCADKLVEMQEYAELKTVLQFLLAASPFILLLPDLAPARSAKEAAGAVAEKMAVMAAEKALGNINTGVAKPDFVTAIQAVEIIVLGQLSGMAAQHMIRHNGTKDGNVWQKLAESYSPTAQRGGGVTNSDSWFPWSWFE
jgi:hypothetical protein